MRAFTLLLTFLLLTACSTAPKRFYSGEAKPREQVAIFSFWLDKTRSVPAADNLRIYYSKVNQRDLSGTRDIEVLPGDYSLLVHCEMGDAQNRKTFDIVAEAGREYAIVAYAEAGRCKFDRLKWVLGPAGLASSGQAN